jgi:hypothetical protein
MAYEFQTRLRQELNERVPRGSRGSRQNEFRMAVWFYRPRCTFEESVSRALEFVRRVDPGFAPQLLPPR